MAQSKMVKNANTAKTKKPAKPSARVLSSRTSFRGRVFKVTSDEVVEPGGIRARRDVVRHSGSVVIMAVDDSAKEPRVLLARQYRYATRGFMWELPAGRIDAGEDSLTAAKRELIEETGYTARSWKRAMFFYSSPGFLDETMSLYLAQGLTRGKARPEEDEKIRKRFFPLKSAIELVMRGKIEDAKTICGVLWLAVRSGKTRI